MMMMRLLFTLILMIGFSFGFAQDLSLKRFIKTDSFKYEIHIASKRILNSKLCDSLVYHWVKAQKLFTTQGGFDGDPLHDNFSKFYLNGQLAEKGKMYYGLKHGEWKVWYANGRLKSIIKYRKGKKHGRCIHFSEDGTVINASTYKNGRIKTPKDNLFNVILGKLPTADEEKDKKKSMDKTGDKKKRSGDAIKKESAS